MSLPARVAFDSSLPVFASQAFTASGRTFKDGDAFPWRDMGLSEDVLANFWRSGLVRFEAVRAPIARPASQPAKYHRR